MTKEDFRILLDKYTKNEMTHHEYYMSIAKIIGITNLGNITTFIHAIKASTDESFNDIPLQKWDSHHAFVSNTAHQYFPCWALDDTVCVLKNVAREIRGH